MFSVDGTAGSLLLSLTRKQCLVKRPLKSSAFFLKSCLFLFCEFVNRKVQFRAIRTRNQLHAICFIYYMLLPIKKPLALCRSLNHYTLFFIISERLPLAIGIYFSRYYSKLHFSSKWRRIYYEINSGVLLMETVDTRTCLVYKMSLIEDAFKQIIWFSIYNYLRF